MSRGHTVKIQFFLCLKVPLNLAEIYNEKNKGDVKKK